MSKLAVLVLILGLLASLGQSQVKVLDADGNVVVEGDAEAFQIDAGSDASGPSSIESGLTATQIMTDEAHGDNWNTDDMTTGTITVQSDATLGNVQAGTSAADDWKLQTEGSIHIKSEDLSLFAGNNGDVHINSNDEIAFGFVPSAPEDAMDFLFHGDVTVTVEAHFKQGLEVLGTVESEQLTVNRDFHGMQTVAAGDVDIADGLSAPGFSEGQNVTAYDIGADHGDIDFVHAHTTEFTEASGSTLHSATGEFAFLHVRETATLKNLHTDTTWSTGDVVSLDVDATKIIFGGDEILLSAESDVELRRPSNDADTPATATHIKGQDSDCSHGGNFHLYSGFSESLDGDLIIGRDDVVYLGARANDIHVENATTFQSLDTLGDIHVESEFHLVAHDGTATIAGSPGAHSFGFYGQNGRYGGNFHINAMSPIQIHGRTVVEASEKVQFGGDSFTTGLFNAMELYAVDASFSGPISVAGTTSILGNADLAGNPLLPSGWKFTRPDTHHDGSSTSFTVDSMLLNGDMMVSAGEGDGPMGSDGHVYLAPESSLVNLGTTSVSGWLKAYQITTPILDLGEDSHMKHADRAEEGDGFDLSFHGDLTVNAATNIGAHSGYVHFGGIDSSSSFVVSRDMNVGGQLSVNAGPNQVSIGGSSIMLGGDSDFHFVVNGAGTVISANSLEFVGGDATNSGEGGAVLFSGDNVQMQTVEIDSGEEGTVYLGKNAQSVTTGSFVAHGALYVGGVTDATTLNTQNTDISGDVTVGNNFESQSTKVHGDVSLGDLSVTKDAAIGENLLVQGNLDVSQDMDITGNTEIAGNFEADGDSLFAGDLAILDGLHSENDATAKSNLNVQGSLTSGSTTLRGGLDVDDMVQVTNNADFGESLTVGHASGSSVTSLTTKAAQDTKADQILTPSVTISSLEQTPSMEAVAVNSDAFKATHVTVETLVATDLTGATLHANEAGLSDVTANGAAHLNNVDVDGRVTVSGTSDVGQLHIAGEFDVADESNIFHLKAGTTSVDNMDGQSGTIEGRAHFNGDVRAKDTTVDGQFCVIKEATFEDDLDVDGNVLVGSAAHVGQNVSVGGNLYGQTLEVDGDGMVGRYLDAGELNVQDGMLGNDLFSSGNAQVSGDLNVEKVAALKEVTADTADLGSVKTVAELSGLTGHFMGDLKVLRSADDAASLSVEKDGKFGGDTMTVGDGSNVFSIQMPDATDIGRTLTFHGQDGAEHGGDIDFRGGMGLDGDGGDVRVVGGNAVEEGEGGDIYINSGESDADKGGDIIIHGGDSEGARGGDVFVAPGNGDPNGIVDIGTVAAHKIHIAKEGVRTVIGPNAINIDVAGLFYTQGTVDGTTLEVGTDGSSEGQTSSESITVLGSATVHDIAAVDGDFKSVDVEGSLESHETNLNTLTAESGKVAYTLGIDDATMIAGNMYVGGPLDVVTGIDTHDIDVAGSVSVGEQIDVEGSAKFNHLIVNDLTVVGLPDYPTIFERNTHADSADIGRDATVGGVVSAASAESQTLSVGDRMGVSGDARTDDLTVGHDGHFNDDFSVTGPLEVAGQATVGMDWDTLTGTVGNDLIVHGSTNVEGILSNDGPSFAKTWEVENLSQLGDTYAHDASVGGAATGNSAHVAHHLEVDGTTDVSVSLTAGDSSSIHGGATASTVTVQEHAVANESLTVNGAMSVARDLGVRGIVSVSGDLTATETYIAGSLNTNADLTAGATKIAHDYSTSDLSVEGEAHVEGLVDAQNSINAGNNYDTGRLNSRGSGTFQTATVEGDMDVDHDLDVDNSFNGDALHVGRHFTSGSLTTDTVNIDGQSTLDGVLTVGQDTFVGGNTEVNGNADVTGSISAHTSYIEGLTSTGDVNVVGAASVGGTLDVTGKGTFGCDGVSVESTVEGGNDLLVDDSMNVASDTSVTGTTHVSGDAYLNDVFAGNSTANEAFVNGDINVGGHSSIEEDVYVGGDVTAAIFGITGTLTGNELFADGDLVTNTSVVGGDSHFGADGLIHGDLHVEETVHFGEDVNLGGPLDVTGSAFLADMSVGAAVSVNENALVMGEASAGGSLTVAEDVLALHLDAEQISVANADVEGHSRIANLNVSGDADFGDNVNVKGDFDVQLGSDVKENLIVDNDFTTDNLNVEGSTHLNHLRSRVTANFNDDVSLDGHLTSEGPADFEGDVSVGKGLWSDSLQVGTLLDVGTNAHIDSSFDTLTVTIEEEAHLNENLHVTGDVHVSLDAKFGEDLTIEGDLTVTESASLNDFESFDMHVATDLYVGHDLSTDGNSDVTGAHTSGGIKSGDATSGPLVVNGPAYVGGDVHASSADLHDDVEVHGEIMITGTTSISDSLTVDVDGSTLDLTVSGSTTLHDTTAATFTGGELHVGHKGEFGNVTVTGTAISGSLESDDLNIGPGNIDIVNVLAVGELATADEVAVGENFQADESVEGSSFTALDLKIRRDVSTDDITVQGTSYLHDLEVNGNGDFNNMHFESLKVNSPSSVSEFYVGGDLAATSLVANFTSAGSAKSNSFSDSNTDVAGDAKFQNQLTTGDLMADSPSKIEENLNALADFTVLGSSYLQDLHIANNFTAANLYFENDIHVEDLIVSGETHSSSFETNVLTVEGSPFIVNGDAQVEGALSVGNSAEFGCDGVDIDASLNGEDALNTNDLHVMRDATITDTLTVEGSTHLHDTHVGGSATFESFTAASLWGSSANLGDTDIDGQMQAGASAVIGGATSGSLNVRSIASVSGDMHSSNARFIGNVEVTGGLAVSHNAESGNDVSVAGGTIVREDLSVEGSTSADDTTAEHMWADGSADIAALTHVDGSAWTSGNADSSSVVTGSAVSGYLQSNIAVTAQTSTTVLGSSSLATVTVSGDTDVSGATHVGESSQQGTTTVGNDLVVEGSTNFQGSSTVNNNKRVLGNLHLTDIQVGNDYNVAGVANSGDINTGSAEAKTLYVGGNTVINGDITVDGPATFECDQTVTVNGDLDNTGSLQAHDLNVQSTADIRRDLHVGSSSDFAELNADNLWLEGDLDVSPNDVNVGTSSNFKNSLDVSEHFDTDTATVSEQTYAWELHSQALNVQHDTDIDGGANIVENVFTDKLQVHGDTSVAGTVSVAADFSVGPVTTINGDLTSSGDLNARGNLQVRGNASVGGDKTVAGQSTSGSVTTGEASVASLWVHGDATVASITVQGLVTFGCESQVSVTDTIDGNTAEFAKTLDSTLISIHRDMWIAGQLNNFDTLSAMDVYVQGKLEASTHATAESLRLAGNIDVDSSISSASVTVESKLFVGSSTTADDFLGSGTLTVVQQASYNDTVDIRDDIHVSHSVAAGAYLYVGKDLYVKGDANMQAVTSKDFHANGRFSGSFTKAPHAVFSGHAGVGDFDAETVAAADLDFGWMMAESVTVDEASQFGCDAPLLVEGDATAVSMSFGGNVDTLYATISNSGKHAGFNASDTLTAHTGVIEGVTVIAGNLLGRALSFTDLTATHNVTVGDTSTLSGGAHFGTLNVKGDAVVNEDAFTVCGGATLNEVSARNLDVGENLRAGNVQSGPTSFGGNYWVAGHSNITDGLTVSGDAKTGSVYSQKGWVGRNLESTNTNNINMLTVRTDASVNNLEVESTLDVEEHMKVVGTTDLFNNVTVNDCKDVEVSGGASITGELDTIGDLSIGDFLNVVGDGQIAEDLQVTAEADVCLDLEVEGSADLRDVVTVGANTDVGGNLDAAGDALFRETLSTGSGVDSTFEVLGALTIGGDVTVDTEFDVAGDAELCSDLHAEDDALLHGHLTVEEAGYVNGETTVLGYTRFGNDLAIEDSMFVGGELCVVQDSHVKGNTLIKENFGVEWDVHFNQNVSVGGDLTVSNYTSVGGQLFANNSHSNQIWIEGDTTIDGDVSVSDLAQIGDFEVNGDLIVTETLETGDVRVSNLTATHHGHIGGSTTVDAYFTTEDLFVHGTTWLNANLHVANDADISNLEINVDAWIGGDLLVFADLKGGDIVAYGNDSDLADVNADNATTGNFEGEGAHLNTLDVSGTLGANSLTVEGNVTNENGDFSAGMWLSVGQDLTVATNLSVSGSLYIDENLNANTAYVNDTLNVWGDQIVDGNTHMNTNLTVDGLTSVCDDITAESNALFEDTLLVHGSASFLSNVDIGGKLQGAENLWVEDLLDIHGAARVGDSVHANQTVQIEGDLSVAEDCTLGDTVVEGPASFLESAWVDTSADIEGWLEVSCTATVDDFTGENLNTATMSVDDALNTTDVSVSGDTEISGELTVMDHTSLASDLWVDEDFSTGDVTVQGSVLITDMLTVTGDASLGGELTVGEQVIVGGDLNTKGSVSIGGELCVEGFTSVREYVQVDDNLYASNIFVDEEITVEGSVVIMDDVNIGEELSIENNAELCDDVSVGGDLTIDGTLFTENFKVENDLTVCGSLNITDDGFNLGNNSAAVQGDFSPGTLEVAGRFDVTCPGDGNVTGSAAAFGFPYPGAATTYTNVNGRQVRIPTMPTAAFSDLVVSFASIGDVNQFYRIALTGCTWNFLEPEKSDAVVYRMETVYHDNGVEVYRYEVGDMILVRGPSALTKQVSIYDYHDVIADVGPNLDGNIYNGRTLFTENANSFIVTLGSNDVKWYMYAPRTAIGSTDSSGNVVVQNGIVEWTGVQ